MRRLLSIGCAALVVVGCGLNGRAPAPAQRARVPRSAPPADPIRYGRQIFLRYGCVACHGADGKSGLANPNAKTKDIIPPVIYVADGYKPAELKAFIRRGQPLIDKLNPGGPTPPFKMPRFADWITEPELDALQKYLFSLMPKEAEEKF